MVDEKGHLQPSPDCDWCHKERYGVLTIGTALLTLCEVCFHKGIKQRVKNNNEYIEYMGEFLKKDFFPNHVNHHFSIYLIHILTEVSELQEIVIRLSNSERVENIYPKLKASIEFNKKLIDGLKEKFDADRD